jgi:hypothetical protein
VHALPERGGGIGPRLVELGGEQLESLLGEQRIGERPRRADPTADRVAIALGQQIADVALLVAIMPMSA